MNDSQKYKLIIWHAFLEDMNKVEHKMDFYGVVQYEARADLFHWHSKQNHKSLYPWNIWLKNKKGFLLLLSYQYFLDLEAGKKVSFRDYVWLEESK